MTQYLDSFVSFCISVTFYPVITYTMKKLLTFVLGLAFLGGMGFSFALTPSEQTLADTLVNFVEDKVDTHGEEYRVKYVRVFKQLQYMEKYDHLDSVFHNVVSRIDKPVDGFYLYGNEANALGYGYTTEGDNVYYHTRLIQGASASSFVVLKFGYSKDSNDVFYQGKKVPLANPESFKVLTYRAAKDNYRVFYHDEVIEEANASHFVIVDADHAKDHNTLFYHKNPIKQY